MAKELTSSRMAIGTLASTDTENHRARAGISGRTELNMKGTLRKEKNMVRDGGPKSIPIPRNIRQTMDLCRKGTKRFTSTMKESTGMTSRKDSESTNGRQEIYTRDTT
jgi:hypothetical protein